jgi:hypothetical protein
MPRGREDENKRKPLGDIAHSLMCGLYPRCCPFRLQLIPIDGEVGKVPQPSLRIEYSVINHEDYQSSRKVTYDNLVLIDLEWLLDI